MRPAVAATFAALAAAAVMFCLLAVIFFAAAVDVTTPPTSDTASQIWAERRYLVDIFALRGGIFAFIIVPPDALFSLLAGILVWRFTYRKLQKRLDDAPPTSLTIIR